MTVIQNVLQQLSGKRILESLEERMTQLIPDFAQARERYENAMAVLEGELGTAAVRKEGEAIAGQMGAVLLFCGALGLKANADHFFYPTARSFLEADPEAYLREPMACNLPEYRQGEETRAQFFALLSPEQQTVYEDVADYVACLNTTGPKLAHYYGYMLGNQLFPKIIPGYYPDLAQGITYREKLSAFFDCTADQFMSLSVGFGT